MNYRDTDAHATAVIAPPREPTGKTLAATATPPPEQSPLTPKSACRPWHRHPLGRLDIAAAAGLLCLTLLIRWPFIERGETLLHSDEAIVGIMAQDIAAGDRYPLYFYGQRYMGALEAYVVAALLPFFQNPIHALRFGPACFFALTVAVQYLMLARWFGRRGGLIGALALLAASPMFMQWSISARGGYVEVLLWGSAILWSYSEWFVPPVPECHRDRRRFILGALIGSGWWINPAIVLFVGPIVLHALLNRPLEALRSGDSIGRALGRIARRTNRATLPLVVLLGILSLNVTWAMWVGEQGVRQWLLLGLFPEPLALAILAAFAAIAVAILHTKTTIIPQARAIAATNASMILGIVVGLCPALLYVLQTIGGNGAMDPSVPLGFRPIWLAGDTLLFLLRGLPLLFGADPTPFIDLVTVGRDHVTAPIGFALAASVAVANRLVFGGIIACVLILLAVERESLSRLFRLEPANHSPTILLMLALVFAIGLYVLGGCTMDFMTIRYLVPIWAFIPGLLAAVFVNPRFRTTARIAVFGVCASWAVGQTALYARIGAPHPLRPVADALQYHKIESATAEILDAHLLSYMTRQQCRTIEYEPFWSRLSHYPSSARRARSTDYVVRTHEKDPTLDWIRGGWPGPLPPETERRLWTRLRSAILADPDLVESRETLAGGYDLIRLRCSLNRSDGS